MKPFGTAAGSEAPRRFRPLDAGGTLDAPCPCESGVAAALCHRSPRRWRAVGPVPPQVVGAEAVPGNAGIPAGGRRARPHLADKDVGVPSAAGRQFGDALGKLACRFDPLFRDRSPALLHRATKPAPAPITITMSAMPDGSGTGCEANETVSNPPGVQPATVCCSQFAPPSLV